jgi:hypothetical protein
MKIGRHNTSSLSYMAQTCNTSNPTRFSERGNHDLTQALAVHIASAHKDMGVASTSCRACNETAARVAEHCTSKGLPIPSEVSTLLAIKSL